MLHSELPITHNYELAVGYNMAPPERALALPHVRNPGSATGIIQLYIHIYIRSIYTHIETGDFPPR